MSPFGATHLVKVLSSAITDGVVLLGESGEIACLNEEAAQILRLDPSAVAGHPFVDFFPSEDFPPKTCAELWEQPVTVQTLCTRGDGSRARMALSILPVRGPDDSREGYVVLIEDLEEKQRADELIRRMDRLASLGELSASMAHEIRNPLAGIQTAAEVLAGRMEADDERRDFVSVILEEVRRLNRIVEDLVRFAKPAPAKLAPCDLHRAIENVLVLLSKHIESENIRVLKRCDPELPAVEADSDQMVQVILNIVLNSIQAMSGGGALEIATSVTGSPPAAGGRAADGPWVRIEVTDSGPGISESALSRVFDPFYTTKPGGTGMGLAICQRIVAAHGGVVSVESGQGKKTRVWVELPTRQRAATAEDPGALSRGAGGGSRRR